MTVQWRQSDIVRRNLESNQSNCGGSW